MTDNEKTCCKPAAPKACGCCCAADPALKKTARRVSIFMILLMISLIYLFTHQQKPNEREQTPQFLAETHAFLSENGQNRHLLTFEIAKTPEQQAKGLMFRTELPNDRGMLFTYDTPQVVSFWMKNTLIPLDIIFIGADRTITKIAKNTIPQNLTPISSDTNVLYVVEIMGGNADRLGLKVGDRFE